MFLKNLKSISLIAAACAVTLWSCSEKKAEEPVAPAAAQTTPTPDPTAGASLDLKTETVYFGYDDYSLTGEAKSKLTALAETLKKTGSAAVQIEGHCDERGSVEYNLALGERRANSVKNFLGQLGVDAARLSTISYGKERPAVQGTGEATWSKNRRAEFVVTNH